MDVVACVCFYHAVVEDGIEGDAIASIATVESGPESFGGGKVRRVGVEVRRHENGVDLCRRLKASFGHLLKQSTSSSRIGVLFEHAIDGKRIALDVKLSSR